MEEYSTDKLKKTVKRYRRANSLLEACILLVALFFIFAPLLPALGKIFAKENTIILTDTFDPRTLFADIDPSIDYLSIPALGIEQEIIEAESIKDVHEFVWRRPQGSMPDKGSNTVLVAHRYATIGGNRSSTFYSLPDIQIGTDIYVRWEGVIYRYQAMTTAVVLPTEIEIENPTQIPMLTLYTCTPLWKADKRFVVTAPLIGAIE